MKKDLGRLEPNSSRKPARSFQTESRGSCTVTSPTPVENGKNKYGVSIFTWYWWGVSTKRLRGVDHTLGAPPALLLALSRICKKAPSMRLFREKEALIGLPVRLPMTARS